MARKAHKPQRSLVSFVTRGVSDRCFTFTRGYREAAEFSRAIALAAMRAVKRGRAKGLR